MFAFEWVALSTSLRCRRLGSRHSRARRAGARDASGAPRPTRPAPARAPPSPANGRRGSPGDSTANSSRARNPECLLTCETTRQRSKNGHSGIHADPGSRPRNTLDRVTLPAQDAAGPQVLGCGWSYTVLPKAKAPLKWNPYPFLTPYSLDRAARAIQTTLCARFSGPSSRAWRAFLTRKSATWRMSSPRR